MSWTFDPIGFVHSPFVERVEAPRQPAADASGGEARIELLAGKGYEQALEDLDAFEHVWVLFVFHRNVEQGRGFRPKVQPPRSDRKRGVFATRSPHRPNPVGLSAVRLLGVEGLTVRIADVDLLDGTPVLDLKPYLPYADAWPGSTGGWLAADPGKRWTVEFAPVARAQLDWLRERGVDLEARATSTLSLGPTPNTSRRIRRLPAGGMQLAVQDWRLRFEIEGERLRVLRVASGYRPAQLLEDPGLALHRAFDAQFR